MSSGVPGVDDVLHGGFIPQRTYLVRGAPGTGKTTFGLQFCMAGAQAGERTLYISLKDPADYIHQKAARLGLDIGQVKILDLSPTPEALAKTAAYELFRPAELQRARQTREITAEVDRLGPRRIVLDGITQFRYLATDSQQFRSQMLSLLRYLTSRQGTVLAISEHDEASPDTDLQFMADGTISLDFGPAGRTFSVLMYTDSGFQEGRHSLKLTDRGMFVYPRLVPAAYRREFTAETIPSGVPQLDELLHGGL